MQNYNFFPNWQMKRNLKMTEKRKIFSAFGIIFVILQIEI